jgi:hypothetical protein
MLADIMKLAGVHKVEPEHLGIEHDPVVITAMPGAAVGGAADHSDMAHDHDDSIEVDGEPSDMRRMMDMMNPDIDEEVDESGYTNTPTDPNIVPEFDANQYAHQENQPGQGDRMDGNMPKAHVTMEQQLMADWKQFMTEGVAEVKAIDPVRSAEVQQIPQQIKPQANRPGLAPGGDPKLWDIQFELQKQGYTIKTDGLNGPATFKVAREAGAMKDFNQNTKNPKAASVGFDVGHTIGSGVGWIETAWRNLKQGYSDGQAGLEEGEEQGVAEGDSGAKYRVKSVGNDVNPATDERCDYYINPVTNKKVYCKPGQKVSKGDHVNPNTGKVTPKG